MIFRGEIYFINSDPLLSNTLFFFVAEQAMPGIVGSAEIVFNKSIRNCDESSYTFRFKIRILHEHMRRPNSIEIKPSIATQ